MSKRDRGRRVRKRKNVEIVKKKLEEEGSAKGEEKKGRGGYKLRIGEFQNERK